MQPTPLLLPSVAHPSAQAGEAADSSEQIGALGHGLRRRLLAMLLLPLCVLAVVNAGFDYRLAGGTALQQDAQLLRLAPLLADSLLSWNVLPAQGRLSEQRLPVMLMAPPVEDFLKERAPQVGYRISDERGRFIAGDDWIDPVVPVGAEPQFSSMQIGGVTYRLISLRASSRAGEVIAQIADGSDARQQWWRALVFKVLVPNLILMVAAYFVVRWAVARALAPLLALARDVQHRSPTDLQPIDPQYSPLEVRPLVESLNRLFGMVNDQVRSQRRFVADAAHQLRTPMAGLQSQVEAWARQGELQGGALSLPLDQVLKLRDATRRTTELANRLLTLSRVDAQALSRQSMREVDLQGLCEEALHQHLDQATAKGLDLGMEGRPATEHGQDWLLREALSNLVDNAVKYTPAGGHVTIRCGRDESGCGWLEVEDTGPGIPEQERDKVLQRFYRSTHVQGAGTGLGLAIVDEIARLHGVVLMLNPGPSDAGLRVRMTWPVRKCTKPEPEKPDSP